MKMDENSNLSYIIINYNYKYNINLSNKIQNNKCLKIYYLLDKIRNNCLQK